MKKFNRIICVALVLLLILSFSSFAVYADEGGAGGENQGEVIEEPEQEAEIPVIVDEDPVEQQAQPAPQQNEVEDEGGYDGGYVEEEDYGSNYVENEYSEDSAAQQSNSGQQTELFDARDISSAEMAANKWSNIELPQQDNSKNSVDFSTIQKDTSAADNGQWILWTGFILMGASLIGILYFVISTIAYRKKLKNLNRRQAKNNSTRSKNHKAERREAPSREAYPSRPVSSSPARSSSRRYAADSKLSYAERKRLKADTAELYIPKRMM